MAKRLQEYVKYTTKELDSYTENKESCVKKVNTNLHLTIGPYALSNFKKALLNHIMQTKIGYFNLDLDGIVLDIKNIKVLGKSCALRFDDPKIHVNINADCYVFRPVAGAVLSGIVKHISTKHVGVIIYRVFNATIRFADTLDEDDVEMDKEVKFRIKSFNMRNVFPYVEGELLSANNNNTSEQDTSTNIENGNSDNNVDSGIEEKDLNELDELISLIKAETTSDVDVEGEPKGKRKATKRKSMSKTSEELDTNEDSIVVKSETKELPKKKKKKSDSNNPELEISIKQEDSS